MALKPEYRDRDDTDVAVLGALADRPDDGMTIFELRAEVEEDIDTIEESLARLKRDRLIEATEEGSQTSILPCERVLTNSADESDEGDLVERIRDRLPF